MSESKNRGFLMQSRGPEVDELLKDPPAFVLITQIARRARRTNAFNVMNLKPGEALIGDYESIGLTEQKYRSAKKRLEEYGLVTFKPTNKGTIATLSNTDIYDINIDNSNDHVNDQATKEQRSNNDPVTTNNKDNNANTEKIERERARTRESISLILQNLPEPPEAIRHYSGFWQELVDYWVSRCIEHDQMPNEITVSKVYDELQVLEGEGNSPVEVLKQSSLAGHKAVYPLRDFEKRQPPNNNAKSKGDKHVEFLRSL